jgi:hypothetical protein
MLSTSRRTSSLPPCGDGLGLPLQEAMGRRYPAVRDLVKSEDVMEGISAFAKKRRPVWKAK